MARVAATDATTDFPVAERVPWAFLRQRLMRFITGHARIIDCRCTVASTQAVSAATASILRPELIPDPCGSGKSRH
jgi:hypothetical protein